MTKWEYDRRTSGFQLDSNELDDMGAEGWELVSHAVSTCIKCGQPLLVIAGNTDHANCATAWLSAQQYPHPNSNPKDGN